MTAERTAEITSTVESAIGGYEAMWVSRAIDDACARLLGQGIPVPNYHSARGQEALYVAAGSALEPGDHLLYNYRAFATLLAIGVTLPELVGDLLLRATGTTGGHGGIMHVVHPDLGLVGRNGVFGSKFGIAVGLGLALQADERTGAVLCMFGEAEGNRGTLYESLNVACLRKLPIVFLAENNGFAVGARTSDIYSTGNMSDLVRGFPMPVESVDGNDLEAASVVIARAMRMARAGSGPAYVECVTYRLDPHHGRDDERVYRTEDEVALHRHDDPIARFRQILLAREVPESDLSRAQARAVAQVEDAVAVALEAPLPQFKGVVDRIYYAGGRPS